MGNKQEEKAAGLRAAAVQGGWPWLQGRLRLGIREHFFSEKVVKHWHQLPRESASLEVFKSHDAALSGPMVDLIGLFQL